MEMPLISVCEHNLKEYYPNDTKRLGYFLSACFLVGIRIGRKLDVTEPILIESDPERKP